MILNQFGVLDVKGDVKNKGKGYRYECLVYASESATLIPGDCVKLVDVAGDVPVIQKIAADTDESFGMVQYESAKKNEYVAGDMITIAGDYSIIACEASAAIAGGAAVAPVITGQKVVTATTGQKIIGKAMIKAASGAIFPVRLLDKGLST